MKRGLISVVMPTHNYGQFITGAIEGILCQTYPEFELIIVDDASTDNTRAIVRSFDDPRIKVVERQVCSRSGNRARNEGLRVARGQFIAVADADDISVPERLELQVDHLRTHPEIDGVGGSLLAISPDHTTLADPTIKPVLPRPQAYREQLLRGHPVINHGTLLYRAEILSRNGLLGYGDYPSSGDTEFMLRATRHHAFVNIGKVLIWCVQHGGSVTRRYGSRLKRAHHQLFILQELIWLNEQVGRDTTELEGQREKAVEHLRKLEARWVTA